jgi:hypothetical protein
MITNILITIICIAAFVTSFWAYRRGLKDGLALNNNKPIEPIKTPVAVIQEVKTAKVTKEQEVRTAQYLENLLNYTGETQAEVKNE